MSNTAINLSNQNIVSALNNKADRELENSNRASNIEKLADSSYELAAATSSLVEYTIDNIDTKLDSKVSNKGDTINGNVVINGTLDVTGGISATIQGTTENATKATQDSNGNVIVSTYATKAEVANISSNPVGTIIAFSGNITPSGYLLCTGATISRTTYSKLFEIIGTLYGEGDGSTTFAIPNLTDKFIQGSGTAGAVIVAGLPNITGEFGDILNVVANASGAFAKKTAGTMPYGNINGGGYMRIDFRASRSNFTYGNSDTVQPPALTMRYYIKY